MVATASATTPHCRAPHPRGPITRLVSPSDPVQSIKPLIFLDRYRCAFQPRGAKYLPLA